MSDTYWLDRANKRMAAAHRQQDKTIQTIHNAYDHAAEGIQKERDRIFQGFLKSDKKLTEQEAKRLLNEAESSKELERIREKIQEITDTELKKQLMKKVNVAYYEGRISRLDAFGESVKIQVARLAEKEFGESTKGYQEIFQEEYYRNIVDRQKKLNLVVEFDRIPEQTIQAVLRENWSGKHYSKRIWGNTEVFGKELQELLLSGLYRGSNSRKLAAELDEVKDTGKYVCERLIRTETTYFVAMGDLEAAKQRGTKYLRFLATLDIRTSEECKKADRTLIPIKDAKPGINIPPLHPFCRSVILDHNPDMIHYLRTARDPVTGKSYQVPADMTYNEWYDQYVAKGKGIKGVALKYQSHIPGITKEVQEIVNQKCRDCAEQGMKEKQEHLYVLNKDTGSEIFHETGAEVGSTEFFNMLEKQDPNSIITIHNHNDEDRFSFIDLNTNLTEPAIHSAIVATPSGKTYTLSGRKPGITEDIYSIAEEYRSKPVIGEKLKNLHKEYKDGIIMQNEYSRLRESLVSQQIAKDYFEFYEEVVK